MDISNIQIGLITAISITSALITALITGLSVFYALKIQLTVNKAKILDLEKEDKVLHSRISVVKEEEKKNKNLLYNKIESIKGEIHKMQINIIKEIHESKTK